jgi:hypothetical protein
VAQTVEVQVGEQGWQRSCHATSSGLGWGQPGKAEPGDVGGLLEFLVVPGLGNAISAHLLAVTGFTTQEAWCWLSLLVASQQ